MYNVVFYTVLYEIDTPEEAMVKQPISDSASKSRLQCRSSYNDWMSVTMSP